MQLKLYNALTRDLNLLVPQKEDKRISLYCCGVTVYDHCHLGHGRSVFVIYDVLVRLLREQGYDVLAVRNITDLDDKIIHKAHSQQTSCDLITQQYIQSMRIVMEQLHCQHPDQEPLATESIDTIINMIQTLIQQGHAYVVDGEVFFEISTFSEYGKLSGQKLEELVHGARVAESTEKRHAGDFTLWKPSKDKEPFWESPWGNGRPGWHIECSVMSEKYLGKEFDLHCGGLDLIFPHHENEIAQSICANDSSIFAKYWMHNGYVTVDGKKMSKSDGNFVTINNLKNNFNGQIVRLSILGTHYRQPLDWNLKILETNKKILENWYSLYSPNEDEINDELFNILLDDLNTPKFITNIHSLYNKAKTGDVEAKKDLNSALKFLGLFEQNEEQFNSLR
ncbi:cysteine--tRNA ligase, partial [bacterium]|nr:cysteine--tRNA ligase [bacterium]